MQRSPPGEAHLGPARYLSHIIQFFFSGHILLSDIVSFICSLARRLSSPVEWGLQQSKLLPVPPAPGRRHRHPVCARIFLSRTRVRE